ncbi:MAG: hypothetical protein MUP85_09285 [Candidatus Lokiarchaeota archaeon]|nr:hypothetical protein [Candidatus Lokiarchaeota archaeon]
MSNQKQDNIEEEIENRLLLFEGIIIGIYGNWLVTLIQMISFTSNLIILQSFLTLISLGSLIALLAVGIFGSRLESRFEVVFLSCGHFLPICITLMLERLLIQDAFFLMIGGILFIMIYFSEFKRVKRRRKK